MRIALVGFGSVGRACAHMLAVRRDDLYSRMGLSPKLVAVLDSRGVAIDPAGLEVEDLLAKKTSSGCVSGQPGTSSRPDIAEVFRRSGAEVLVEASPSVIANPDPPIANIKAAFAAKMHAISVNKAALAVALPALADLARFNKVQLRYSGSVGAGTPVLATARALAAGDRVLRVRGILNGTTNFILWRMLDRGDSYAGALAEAIRLGYAETDPSADVDGIDTASKIVILAAAVLNQGITIRDVDIQGIRDTTRDQIDRLARDQQSLKLIGEIDAVERRVRVRPQPVPRFTALDVPASMNAVQFTLESGGDVTLVGRGAGGPETATAIIRDLVDIWNSTHP